MAPPKGTDLVKSSVIIMTTATTNQLCTLFKTADLAATIEAWDQILKSDPDLPAIVVIGSPDFRQLRNDCRDRDYLLISFIDNVLNAPRLVREKDRARYTNIYFVHPAGIATNWVDLETSLRVK